jgi:hypothetical protein
MQAKFQGISNFGIFFGENGQQRHVLPSSIDFTSYFYRSQSKQQLHLQDRNLLLKFILEQAVAAGQLDAESTASVLSLVPESNLNFLVLFRWMKSMSLNYYTDCNIQRAFDCKCLYDQVIEN